MQRQVFRMSPFAVNGLLLVVLLGANPWAGILGSPTSRVSLQDEEASPCAANERFHEGNCVQDPVPTRKTHPDYPKRAKRHRIEARVRLRATIETDGTVTNVEVLECSRKGYGFEKAAKRAVLQWNYRPARVNGEITAVLFEIVVDFKSRPPEI